MKRLRKSTKSQKDNYRPTENDLSVKEAKEVLKKRYEDRGYEVKKITRHDWHFLVSFGVDEDGKGLGPHSLPNCFCNWPAKGDK